MGRRAPTAATPSAPTDCSTTTFSARSARRIAGMGSEVTVGIDIGTSSVKAIAADGDGRVVASARVRHPFYVRAPGRFEHDANEAWRRGPAEALAALGDVDA